MAGNEDDELLLVDAVEGEEPEIEDQDEGGEPEGDELEDEIIFDDGAAPAPGERDTRLVKHLREINREQAKRLAEAERRQSLPELGPKPTLEACDYDEDTFEKKLVEWQDRKRERETVENTAATQQRQAQEEWGRDYQGYQQKRAALAYADRDEAEATAVASLTKAQQAVVVQTADNPALLLYALAKHPAKLAEISQISNPLKMAVAIAKLEGVLKVKRKRTAPEPERIERGSARVSAKGPDKELERLEKKAAQTGDRSEVVAYKAQLRSRAA